uniref:Uncharacterized protein n=1 Tax=Solanum lycopersicum TaxID=4081 RepID=A0A3Q7IVS7_SOLLC
MVLRPTCMVYPPLASQSQANWKLEGQSTKQCSTSSNECLTTFIMTEDTVIISNVTGFFSPAETHPLDAICFEAFAEQKDRLLNATNIWNLSVSYNKLCFEAVNSGAKDLPFSR